MEGRQFDEITHRLVRTRLRRTVLRSLAGIVVATGTARLRVGDTAAAPKPKFGRCRNGTCCSHCRPGLCKCTCVDLQFDEDHCGACFRPCPANEVCHKGKCCIPEHGSCANSSECCGGGF